MEGNTMTFTIIGRRWFERVNGNTYHSVEVYKGDKLIERVPFQYGYGDGYMQTAGDIIAKHFPTLWNKTEKLAGYKLSTANGLSRYNKNIKIIQSVTDVERKKYL